MVGRQQRSLSQPHSVLSVIDRSFSESGTQRCAINQRVTFVVLHYLSQIVETGRKWTNRTFVERFHYFTMNLLSNPASIRFPVSVAAINQIYR